MQFGDRLGALRRKENKTQAEMATKFGKSLNAYKSWELNISRPDYETVISIADHFHISIDFLLGRSPESEPRIISDVEMLLRPDKRGKYLDTILGVNQFISAYPENAADFCIFLDIGLKAYHKAITFKPSERLVKMIREDPQTIATMFSDNKETISALDGFIDDLRRKLYGLVTWAVIDTSLME